MCLTKTESNRDSVCACVCPCVCVCVCGGVIVVKGKGIRVW